MPWEYRWMSLDFYLVNEWEGRSILAGCLKTQGRRDLKLLRVQRKGNLEVWLACHRESWAVARAQDRRYAKKWGGRAVCGWTTPEFIWWGQTLREAGCAMGMEIPSLTISSRHGQQSLEEHRFGSPQNQNMSQEEHNDMSFLLFLPIGTTLQIAFALKVFIYPFWLHMTSII